MYPHFLAYCLNTPWAMEPGSMRTYAMILANAYARKAGAEIAAFTGQPQEPQALGAEPSGQPGGGIAVLPVFGAIVQRASELGPCEGGTGAVEIGRALDALAADSSVAQILMQFSTPGGSVFGITELGDKIRAVAKSKPVIGIADSMAASAGYWLLSQCSEAYITPGGMAGSIGVITAHEDVSAALEATGVKINLITSGKYKAEGNPFEPLGEEARAEIQGQCDAYYSAFTKAVARGRGVPVEAVRNDMGQGRMLLADAALKAGMVDGVETFDGVVAKMRNAVSGRRRSMQAAAVAADIQSVA